MSSFDTAPLYVGMRRLERPTSRPPDVNSNQLSYIPNNVNCCIAGANIVLFYDISKFLGIFVHFFP